MEHRRWHQNNVPAARALRRPLTPSESILWAALRNRAAGWKFRRQHPIGRFVLDFYCHEARLAVEIDGSVHAAPEAKDRDRERQELLEELGIEFLRFFPRDVEDRLDWVLARIDRTCSARSTLTPTPLPEGEGLSDQ